jgi:hypothetical protein
MLVSEALICLEIAVRRGPVCRTEGYSQNEGNYSTYMSGFDYYMYVYTS